MLSDLLGEEVTFKAYTGSITGLVRALWIDKNDLYFLVQMESMNALTVINANCCKVHQQKMVTLEEEEHPILNQEELALLQDNYIGEAAQSLFTRSDFSLTESFEICNKYHDDNCA